MSDRELSNINAPRRHSRRRTAAFRWLVPLAVVSASLATVPLLATAAPEGNARVEGFVIAPDFETVYVSVEEAARALDLCLRRDEGGKSLYLGEAPVEAADRAALPDGTLLVRLRALSAATQLGLIVNWDPPSQTATIERGERRLSVRRGRRTLCDGITFAGEPGTLYVPAPELERTLGTDEDGAEARSGRAEEPRRLPEGTRLVSVNDLDRTVRRTQVPGRPAFHLEHGEWEVWVRRAPKRVAINLKQQQLRAWEGKRLVLETPVSTGRKGKDTPQGAFRAGPLKSQLVISRKYGNARMPWSVQVRGNIFIHGFASVPRYAASHGCIRVPLSGANPARWFYDWVTLGTPIEIRNHWPAAPDDSGLENPAQTSRR